MGQPLDNSLACPLLLCGSPQVTEKKAQGSRPSATRQHLERHAPASRAPGQARPSARKAPGQARPSASPSQAKREESASPSLAKRQPRAVQAPDRRQPRPGLASASIIPRPCHGPARRPPAQSLPRVSRFVRGLAGGGIPSGVCPWGGFVVCARARTTSRAGPSNGVWLWGPRSLASLL